MSLPSSSFRGFRTAACRARVDEIDRRWSGGKSVCDGLRLVGAAVGRYEGIKKSSNGCEVEGSPLCMVAGLNVRKYDRDVDASVQ